MMNRWKLNNELLDEIPDNAYGFCYRITSPIGYYIGSKCFYSTTNPKISKKRSGQIYKGTGRRPIREKKVKESNWKEYRSSSKIVKELLIEYGEDQFDFEILEIFDNKQEMLLKEAYLIAHDFLARNPILNEWISLRCGKLK